MNRWPALVLMLAFSFTPFQLTAQSVSFYDHAQLVTERQLNHFVEAAISESVTILNPRFREDRKYVAFRLASILDGVYGELWRKAEFLLFACKDGYQPIIKVDEFLSESNQNVGFIALDDRVSEAQESLAGNSASNRDESLDKKGTTVAERNKLADEWVVDLPPPPPPTNLIAP